jgi:anti-sigma factor RsiW
MHGLITERFEEYLDGTLEEGELKKFEAHLLACEDCKTEVEMMQEQVLLLHSLRVAEPVEPPPGFYARVADRIETERRPPFWAAFLQPAFARQLVFSSLVIVLLVGGYMVMGPQETAIQERTAPATVAFMEPDPETQELGKDRKADRAVTLVNLATFDGDYGD